MNKPEQNPPITPFLRTFTLIETLVLIVAGAGLFLFPDVARAQWPWELAPFNARFLGAIYLGAMMPIGMMYRTARWSPARPVLRAIFVFTFMALIVSLAYSSKFDFTSWAVWGWFALYITLPFSAGYHLWLYRSMPTEHLNPVPTKWRFILRSTGILLGLYGLGLLIMPDLASALFPWKLGIFHSQMYSATFIAGSAMMFSIATRATPAEFIATGLNAATFGTFAILGLFIVNASVNKINWAAANTWGWLVSLAALAVLGIAMIVAGKRNHFS